MNKKIIFTIFIILSYTTASFAKENIKSISVSSTLVEKGKASDFYSSSNLMDNSYKSWVEGVDGDGIGESISFEFESPIDIKGIGIRNGYGDLRFYFANNRVKHLEVYINDTYKTCFRLADSYDSYIYSFLRYENVKKNNV